jgi:hypothetical protein
MYCEKPADRHPAGSRTIKSDNGLEPLEGFAPLGNCYPSAIPASLTYIISEMFRPEFEKLCANFERQVTGFFDRGLGVSDFVGLNRLNVRIVFV